MTIEMNPVLHYIYDPFCGWCYGAAPLLAAAATLDGIELRLHAGGMLAGARSQKVTPQLREMVNQYDGRIAELSGQVFGTAYRDGLLCDADAVFDSVPPTTAILAAEQTGRGLAMLHRIQQAHYIEGQRVADEGVLTRLAGEIGVEDFSVHYAQLQGAPTEKHIRESRELLAQVGGQGFPTFILEIDGRRRRLEHGPFLGQPQAWKRQIFEAQPV